MREGCKTTQRPDHKGLDPVLGRLGIYSEGFGGAFILRERERERHDWIHAFQKDFL